jgi:hypothetical protein
MMGGPQGYPQGGPGMMGGPQGYSQGDKKPE